MRTLPLNLALSIALSIAPALSSCRGGDARPTSDRAPTTSEDAPRSILPFDGRSLDGWDGDPRFWSVEDGVLVGRSSAENPCHESTYLVWRAGEVADFELEFEYRITGGNSGMQFRSREVGRWQVAGPQADIEDGPNWSGCLYEQDGRGVVARRGERVRLEPSRRSVAELGDKAQLDRLARPREWNRYTIRAAGPLIELALNGVTTVEVLDLDPERFQPRGLLALQLHAGGPMQIEVRGLKLTPIQAPATPAPNFLAADPSRTAAAERGAKPPQWVWSSPQPRDLEAVALERRFELAAAPAKATLRATADDHLRVYVNGELALGNDEWWRPREVDATKWVRAGENVISAIAKNDYGPAAVWVELVVDGPRGRVLRLATDGGWSTHGVDGARYADWRPAEFDRARAGAPHVIGPLGSEPWSSAAAAMGGLAAAPAPVPSSDERALEASALELPEGFAAELLYSVPKGQQGSWVVLCEDAQGRFYVSDQYGALYRVTAAPLGSSDATRVERVPVELGMAQGLCWAFDALYVVVAEGSKRSPGLYRCRDTDGDDALDSVELLRAFQGGGEHGPHAVVLGPDRKLWIVGGNHTALPEPIDASWMPRNWGEDLLLPRIDDPNGHAVGVMAPGGWIVRTDENAQRWELWAAGFRNAYDIAFDERGELFTFDSDMEWDVGLPWYRPARVCQVPPGVDFGWRHGSGKWPSWYVDSAPATCDVGLASPTGVVFGTNANFPGRYQRALFAADWAYGTVYAVWGERSEKFLTGKPFPVTDMVVARDGALYLTTGGRRTQSGLYRVSWTRPLEEQGGAVTIRAPSGASVSEELRKALDPEAPAPTLEALRTWSARVAGFSLPARSSRNVLERGSPDDLLELLRTESDERRLAPIAAAAIRAAPSETRELVLRRLTEQPLANVGEGYRLDTLRAMGLALLRLDVDAATRAAWGEKLLAAYPYGMQRTDRELAQLLAHLGETRMIAPSLELLASAATQEEKLWYAYCLRVVRRGWSLEQRRQMLDFLDREARTFRGGHSLAKYVERIRAEFVDGLSDEEHGALADVLSPVVPVAAQPVGAPGASFVKAWTRDDLAPLVREALVGRDFERGRSAYSKSRCTECHRLGGEGGSTGPDLTGAGSRFSRLDLLDALLTPSATISDQYQDVELLTHDGDLFVGRVEGESEGVLKLRRLPPLEDVVELELASIASRRPHPLSRMPSGLVDVLEEQELLDLIAFVLSGANASDPAFH